MCYPCIYEIMSYVPHLWLHYQIICVCVSHVCYPHGQRCVLLCVFVPHSEVGKLAVMAPSPEVGKLYLVKEEKIPNGWHRAHLLETGKRVRLSLLRKNTVMVKQ